MTEALCATATLTCTFGSVSAILKVVALTRVNTVGKALATVTDHAPLQNIQPFGLCNAPSNPQVASAQSPQPCQPVTTMPWTPGSATVRAGKQAVVHRSCQLTCQWGGIINATNAGQRSVTVGS